MVKYMLGALASRDKENVYRMKLGDEKGSVKDPGLERVPGHRQERVSR